MPRSTSFQPAPSMSPRSRSASAQSPAARAAERSWARVWMSSGMGRVMDGEDSVPSRTVPCGRESFPAGRAWRYVHPPLQHRPHRNRNKIGSRGAAARACSWCPRCAARHVGPLDMAASSNEAPLRGKPPSLASDAGSTARRAVRGEPRLGAVDDRRQPIVLRRPRRGPAARGTCGSAVRTAGSPRTRSSGSRPARSSCIATWRTSSSTAT